MAKHILIRLGLLVGILLLATLLLYLFHDTMGAAMYSVIAGLIASAAYVFYLFIESVVLFRKKKTGRGFVNLFTGMVLLIVVLLITHQYFFEVF